MYESCPVLHVSPHPMIRTQVMYAYSKNRKATQPCLITLSGLGEVMRAQVGKLTGFDTWLGVTTDSRCYTEIFDKGRRERKKKTL